MTATETPQDEIRDTPQDAPVVIGLHVDLTVDPPMTEWVTTATIAAPTLTHDLIDALLDGIDTRSIEEEALASTGLGERVDLPARTLAILRDRLHSRLHDLAPLAP